MTHRADRRLIIALRRWSAPPGIQWRLNYNRDDRRVWVTFSCMWRDEQRRPLHAESVEAARRELDRMAFEYACPDLESATKSARKLAGAVADLYLAEPEPTWLTDAIEAIQFVAARANIDRRTAAYATHLLRSIGADRWPDTMATDNTVGGLDLRWEVVDAGGMRRSLTVIVARPHWIAICKMRGTARMMPLNVRGKYCQGCFINAAEWLCPEVLAPLDPAVWARLVADEAGWAAKQPGATDGPGAGRPAIDCGDPERSDWQC